MSNVNTNEGADGIAAPSGPNDVEGLNIKGKTTKPTRFSPRIVYIALGVVGLSAFLVAYEVISSGSNKQSTTTTTVTVVPPLVKDSNKITTTNPDGNNSLDNILKEGVNNQGTALTTKPNAMPPLNEAKAPQGNKNPAAGEDALTKVLNDTANKTGNSSDPLAGTATANNSNQNTTPKIDFSGPSIQPNTVTVPNAGPNGFSTNSANPNTIAQQANGVATTIDKKAKYGNGLFVGGNNRGQESIENAANIAIPSSGTNSNNANTNNNNGNNSATEDRGGLSKDAATAAAITAANSDGPAYLPAMQKKPVSKYELWAGFIIPALLDSGINTELPGPVMAHVTHDVYDSKTGLTLLIPKGSRLIGKYGSVIENGQIRVQVTWDRMYWPDGKYISLLGQLASEPEGQSGLYGDLNDHRGRIFTASIFTALLSAGTQILANAGRAGQSQVTTTTTTPTQTNGQIVTQGVGTSIAQTGQNYIDKLGQAPPELTVPKGKPFNIILDRSIVLPPWQYE